jgi:hypothetical protein
MPSIFTLLLSGLPLFLLILLVWRQSKEKCMKIHILWISLLLVLILCIFGISRATISNLTTLGILLACGVIGLAVGVIRGHLTKLEIDVEHKALILQGTSWSILVFVVFFIVKQGIPFLSKAGVASSLFDLLGSDYLFLTACTILGMRLYWYWQYFQARRASNAYHED